MKIIKQDLKLMLMGGYSFAITLPRSWITSHKEKQINMFVDDKNRLILEAQDVEKA
jgi:hypothetical protein